MSDLLLLTTEQILADYPDLEADDIRAALAYAVRLSQIKRIDPLAAMSTIAFHYEYL